MGIECAIIVQRLGSRGGRRQPIRVSNGKDESDGLPQGNQDWLGYFPFQLLSRLCLSALGCKIALSLPAELCLAGLSLCVSG